MVRVTQVNDEKIMNLLEGSVGTKFSVVIVGMGRIGYKYDFESGLETHLSHFKSIEGDNGFDLVGCVDPNISSLDFIHSIPPHLLFHNIEELMGKVNPDYFVISTSTSELFKTARLVLENFKPKVILVEKPVSHDLTEIEKLIDLSKIHDVAIFVNYSRRVDPGFIEFHQSIESRRNTKFIKGFAYYSKGIFNNGSHLIDLLTWFFGDCLEVNMRSVENLKESDPSIDFEMVFESGTVNVFSLNSLEYHPFGADLFFSSQLVRINSGFKGIDILAAESNPILPHDLFIDSVTKRITTDMKNSQRNVNREILSFLRSGTCRLPKLEDGAKIIKLINEMVGK